MVEAIYQIFARQKRHSLKGTPPDNTFYPKSIVDSLASQVIHNPLKCIIPLRPIASTWLVKDIEDDIRIVDIISCHILPEHLCSEIWKLGMGRITDGIFRLVIEHHFKSEAKSIASKLTHCTHVFRVWGVPVADHPGLDNLQADCI